MKDYKMPGHDCLRCHGVLNGATNVTNNAMPKDGDLTICIYCGHLMAFTDDLSLRELTAEEQEWCNKSNLITLAKESVKDIKAVHPDRRTLQ